MHRVQQDVLGKLSMKHPAGAYVKAKWGKLVTRALELENKGLQAAEQFKDLLTDPTVIAAINDNVSSGKYDDSKIAPALRPKFKQLSTFIKRFHDIQRQLGVYVWEYDKNGKPIARPALDAPGYFMMAINPKVYAAMRDGGTEWERYKADFKANWQQHRGNNPEWSKEADAALEEMAKPLSSKRASGGEPVFSAVRMQQGIPLPTSWRGDNLYQSLQHYIHRWAQDLAWADVVQKDPVLRKIFGIKEDPKGQSTADTDPSTFEKHPREYAEALREGSRLGAKWAEAPDPRVPIDQILDPGDIQSIVGSYTKLPALGPNTGTMRMAESVNQLASAIIMQTPTSIRDFAQSVTSLPDYLNWTDIGPAIDGFVKAIADPKAGMRQAQAAGAMSPDEIDYEYAADMSGRLRTAMFKAAKGIRKLTGRNFLDQWGKSVIYHTINETVLGQLANGRSSSLVAEFGPMEMGNLTPEQIASQTATAVVDRIQPRYDANNLPATMLPQNRTVVGAILRLSAWNIAKYNKWYEDAVIPAYRGKPQRLIKSLLLGGVLGSAATQGLIAALTDKKPEDLTWMEWMNLPSDDVKRKEFFPMLFAYIQAQGTMGSLGDIGYQVSRVASGKDLRLRTINPQLPAWILAGDVIDKTMSAFDATKDGYMSPRSLQDIGWFATELAQSAQNVKMLSRWFDLNPGAEGRRERRLFTELYGLSPQTLNTKEVEPYSGRNNAFTLNKALERADTKEEFLKLLPALKERYDRGGSIKPQSQEMDPLFYLEVARRRGDDVARRLIEEDLMRTKEMKGKKRLVEALVK